ncbi:MAG: polyamine aminopropyltransferase [Planctomycetia bacterium]
MVRTVSEMLIPGYELSLVVEEVLAEEESPFQTIGMYRTQSHGVLMTLDGSIMLTERDEYVYHEMITHLPLFSHPNPKRVLVVGGGDLGTVRECLKHPGVEEIHLVEIDRRVIELSRQYYPWAEAAAVDPRVTISCADGFELLQRPELHGRYDLAIIDSSEVAGLDETAPAAKLFSTEFFGLVKNVLAPGGIVVGQCESPHWHVDFIVASKKMLKQSFQKVEHFSAAITTYPGGLWCFYFASDAVNPKLDFRVDAFRAAKPNLGLKYYTDAMHYACFALPANVADRLAAV